MLQIKIDTDIDNTDIKDWDELWNKSQYHTYFNSFNWFENCLKSFNIKKYVIFKIYDSENKLKLLLPLVYKNRTTLISMGGKYLDKTTLLFEDNNYESINTLMSYLKEKGITIILNECSSKMIDYFKENAIIEFASDNPYTFLNDDIKNNIKPKERRHIENLIRNNESLNYKIIDGFDVKKFVNIMFDIELRSNKISKKSSLFVKEEAKKLFYNIATSSKSIICILYENEQPIAHMFGMSNLNKEFMAYHMAYDKNYSKLQPGKIVIYHLMDYLKKNNYSIFDFSRGKSVLKRHFSNKIEENYNIYLNPTINIKLKIKLKKNKQKIKKIIKKILKEIGIWKRQEY